MKKKKKVALYVLLTVVVLGLFSYYQNNSITTTNMSIQSDQIPEAFNGYKVVQLSDLHSKSFGKNQRVLVEKVKETNPDVIVFTGDLVDSKKYNEENSVVLMELLTSIAPVYYVSGNHEWWSERFATLEERLTSAGVKVLRNSSEVIERENEQIHIVGIDDPAIQPFLEEGETTDKAITKALEGIDPAEHFTILLAHRPEYFGIYAEHELDLALAGHAHGGQVRIPFIGGVVAPNQGFFPEYTSGTYTEADSKMIVHRGLGNSIIPQRIFNRPEIIVITLASKNE
ncbi:metallophosphoesterase [Bacillus spongiae]|uniref:Metallophosphoesterase n=1 Tax=Bacillus spongiae TaxID=2683610 RepID=A0ABU8HGT1_9BACI